MPVYIKKLAHTSPTILDLAVLKTQLKLDVANTTEDTLLSGYIAAAIKRAEKYTGISINQTKYELSTNGFTQCIPFMVGVVAVIDSVKYTDTAGDEKTVAAENYTIRSLDDYKKEIYFLNGFVFPGVKSSLYNALKINITTGFDADTIPKDMRQAIILMAASFNEVRTDSVEKFVKASENLLYNYKFHY